MPDEPPSSKADQYRRRAAALAKRGKNLFKRDREPLLRKQKALEDMARNEDWLEGKPGSQLKDGER